MSTAKGESTLLFLSIFRRPVLVLGIEVLLRRSTQNEMNLFELTITPRFRVVIRRAIVITKFITDRENDDGFGGIWFLQKQSM